MRQACILYGVGEFSRDLDVVTATDRRSFNALQAALANLHATQLYRPALDSPDPPIVAGCSGEAAIVYRRDTATRYAPND